MGGREGEGEGEGEGVTVLPLPAGAGVGLFLTYSTFMKRTQGAVKLGTLTPFLNNIVRSAAGQDRKSVV